MITQLSVVTAQKALTARLASELVLEHDREITKALRTLNAWYFGKNLKKIAEIIEPEIQLLVSLFPYVPYGGKLYRALSVTPDLAAKLEVGKTYRLSTGHSRIQSWTVSPANARRFARENFVGSWMVVSLESKAFELLNPKWIWGVAQQLTNKAFVGTKFYREAGFLENSLRNYRAEGENEVIVKSDTTNKIRVLLVGKNRSLITGE